MRTWIRGTLAIAGRELFSLFVTPLGYGVATLFLLLQGWDFSLLLSVLNDPRAAPGPVMQFYFGGSFFIFWLPVIFTCAAISMRTLAEERRAGTLEALLTAPIGPLQVVVGKYVGAVAFYVALWLPTGVFFILLRGAQVVPDPGPVASGYLGTFAVGGTFLAVGMAWSAGVRHQIAAAVGTLVSCTILVLVGLAVDQVEREAVRGLLERTSLLAMMQELAQGIVDGAWWWIAAAVVTVCLVGAATIIDPRRGVDSALRGLFVGVVAVSLATLGARHSARQDWTGGAVYTLGDRAREILTGLTGRVDVRVVMPEILGGGVPNPVVRELREVLQRMVAVNRGLRVRFVDPDRNREQAEQLVRDFGVAGRDLAEGVVLLRAGSGPDLRRSHLFPSELVTYATGIDVQASGPRIKAFRGEETLLRAFLDVTDVRRPMVCVTQGHGEAELDSFEPYGGYAHLDRLLADARMEVRPVAVAPDLDEACEVVLVAGPGGPLPADLVRAIGEHRARGGALMVFAGAVVPRERNALSPNGLEPLLAQSGIRLGDRVVLDPHLKSGAAPLLAFTIRDGWGDHPAVRALVGRPVSLSRARELELSTDLGAHAILSVGLEGWAEADVAGLGLGEVPALDPDRDRAGPIPVVAVAGTETSRVAVIASQDFALNANFRPDVAYDRGRDLVLNLLAWLTGRREILGIREREREHVKLVLLPEQLRRMVWVASLGPASFALALGGWVAVRRRRR